MPEDENQRAKTVKALEFKEELPQGIIGWILWSLPKSIWRYVIWLIAAFIALTGAVAFYQLSTIRSTLMEQAAQFKPPII